MPRLIGVVREANPTRAIVVGSAGWSNWRQLENLQLPEDRANLVATFHYYDPFEFTHQGAEWVGANADEWLGREWTGTEQEQAAVREALDAAAAFGRENGVPMYLGEFGAYGKAPDASRAAWTAFIAREAEARNMPWSYWEFCAGFGVYDREARAWRPALKAALLPE
jgi:endoglucanase